MIKLAGKRILIVEDETLVAMMLEDMLTELRVTVVGPAFSISKALSLAGTEQIDAAVLDVNVRGERIDPVAEILALRSIPVVYATGYGDRAFPLAQPMQIVEKPYTREKIEAALLHAFSEQSRPVSSETSVQNDGIAS